MGSPNQSQSPSPKTPALLCLVVLSSLAVLAPISSAQNGAIVVHRNLGELVDRAGIIVVGKILSARVQPHPEFKNLPTVLVTVEVEESLKGDVGGLYVYRQAILDVREQYDSAGYKKGEPVLLLLAKPSRMGLSSPMGLAQGRFRIVEGPAGRKAAVNGMGNGGLLVGMRTSLRQRGIDPNAAEDALLEQERGPVRLEELKSLIRKIVERP